MPTSPVPPGARSNPSAWSRRAPPVVLALLGCGIAAYLAAYQLGWVQQVWDPLFGRGSQVVLTSWVSRALPIPDAALGALAYLADAITGAIGGEDRWRRLPGIVLLFGLVVLGLVVVAVLLVLAQALLFHTGCTLCLVSAAISFTTGWFAHNEVLASLRQVRAARARGESLWTALAGTAGVR